MGTVLFAAENMGRPIDSCALRPFLEGAAAQGQRVVVLTSDLISARRWLCQIPATVGFAPDSVERWQTLFREFEPDLIVAVGSPTALAAAEHWSCDRVVLNLGTDRTTDLHYLTTLVTTLPELCDATNGAAHFV